MEPVRFTEDDVQQLIQGNERAFRQLYALYGNRLYFFSRKLGLGTEDSEEIVQETFLRLWLNRASIRPDTPVGAFVITIARLAPEANQRVEQEIFTIDSVHAFFRDNIVSIRMDMGTEEGKAFAPNLHMLMYPAYVFYDAKGAQLQYTNAHSVQNNPALLMEKARLSAAVAEEKELNTRSIEFVDASWTAALQQAKETGKLIFLDAHTEWCRPCRMMERDVFTLDRVADFYNANFINVNMDMEKGEGPALAKKHGIRSYPSFLFIDGDGEVVHRDDGYKQPDVFIEVGRAALAKIQSGVMFEEGNWESILAKAQQEDKLIFLDAFAVWCGPCKVMDRDVFPLLEVGDFFNSQFVNVKRDMEKDEGLILRERYNVTAYPTYLFINGSGEEVHRIVGSASPEVFLEWAKAALDPTMRREHLEARYLAGERSLDFINRYLDVLSVAYLRDEAAEVATDYLEHVPSGQLITQPHWEMAQKYLRNANSPVLREFAVHRDQLREFGVTDPERAIADLYSGGIYQWYQVKGEQGSSKNEWKSVKKTLKRTKLDSADELIRLGNLLESAQSGKWKAFASILEGVAEKGHRVYGQTVAVTVTQFAPRLLRASGAKYTDEILEWTDVLLARLDHKLDQSKIYTLRQQAFELAGHPEAAAEAAEASKRLVAQWQEDNKGSGMMQAIPMKLQ